MDEMSYFKGLEDGIQYILKKAIRIKKESDKKDEAGNTLIVADDIINGIMLSHFAESSHTFAIDNIDEKWSEYCEKTKKLDTIPED